MPESFLFQRPATEAGVEKSRVHQSFDDIHAACEMLPPNGGSRNFRHHNPLKAFADRPFAYARRNATAVCGGSPQHVEIRCHKLLGDCFGSPGKVSAFVNRDLRGSADANAPRRAARLARVPLAMARLAALRVRLADGQAYAGRSRLFQQIGSSKSLASVFGAKVEESCFGSDTNGTPGFGGLGLHCSALSAARFSLQCLANHNANHNANLCEDQLPSLNSGGSRSKSNSRLRTGSLSAWQIARQSASGVGILGSSVKINYQ